MRLNRFLATAGYGSRRGCEQLIRDGRVFINGKRVSNLATDVREGDAVKVGSQLVEVEAAKIVLTLHKPAGVLCSTVDTAATPEGEEAPFIRLPRQTVFDLIPKKFPRLFYVGRLDVESEGLLILTNDGDLAQRLTHPKYKLPKVYHVWLNREFDFQHAPKMLKGFMIEPGYAKVESIHRVGNKEVKIVLAQGLKRQIRHMMYKMGYEVERLVRTQIGDLHLGELRPGEWKVIGHKEISLLSGKTEPRRTTKKTASTAPEKSHEIEEREKR